MGPRTLEIPVSICPLKDSKLQRVHFHFRPLSKVIHPKFYKHLKEVAQDSHLGTQKMSWFLADRLVHQVKPEILNNISNLEFNPEFSVQFRLYFHPQILESESNES